MKKLLLMTALLCVLVRVNYGQQVQAQSTRLMIYVNDAKELEYIAPGTTPNILTTSVIYTYKTYGADEQRIYYWRTGPITNSSTENLATMLANRFYIVPKDTTGGIVRNMAGVGYWSRARTFIDATFVRNLDSTLIARGFPKGVIPTNNLQLVNGAGYITLSTGNQNYVRRSEIGTLTGPQGQQGPQGVVGPTGQTGATGSQGPIGLTGPQGPAGKDGANGKDGTNGSNGIDGAVGAQGLKGDQGLQGIQGPKGDKGDTGTTGLTGATGTTGATGLQGIKGDKGDTGAQGPIGLTGATGPAGSQGIQGTTGQTGATGSTGPQGPAGTPATPNTASTPLLITGNNISIQTASSTLTGALTASDWNTFNNKLSGITSAQVATALGYTPYNGTTNPNGYLTSVPVTSVFGRTGAITAQTGDYSAFYKPIGYTPTSAEITSSLGYTPYNSTNPAGYISSYTETDPLYTTNGTPKSRTVATGYGLTGGGDLSANRTLLADTASATGLVSKTRLNASLAGVVKNVLLGGGTASFTTSSLLAGGTNTVTVPLNQTFSDTNYQITQPMILGSGGVVLLGGTFTLVSIVKNTTSVVITLRNNALLALAVTGTIDIEAMKVVL